MALSGGTRSYEGMGGDCMILLGAPRAVESSIQQLGIMEVPQNGLDCSL